MSQKSAQATSAGQQEPSMEEILASIRRIISDDDAPEASPAEEAKAAQPTKHAPAKQAVKKEEVKPAMAAKDKQAKNNEPSFEEDDLLELTDMMEDEEELLELEDALELEDEVVQEVAPVEAKVQPVPAKKIKESIVPKQNVAIQKVAIQKEDDNSDHLVSDAVEAHSAAALSELVSVVSKVNYSLGRADRTLEDIVRDALKPLLKQWLDDHLSLTVEKIVREEVERIVKKLEQK